MACDRSYEECVAQAHPCFGHKMKFWREQGMAGIALPDHEFWSGPTLRERIDQTITNAKANGYDPVPCGRAELI